MCGNEVSKTNQKQIIGAYLNGTRQRVISAQLGILTSTICDIIERYKETGSTEPKQCPGRPKLLSEHDTRALKHIIQTDRFFPLGDVTDKLNNSFDTTLHYNTVRSYVHNEGLGSYTAIKKPHLTQKHQTNHLR